MAPEFENSIVVWMWFSARRSRVSASAPADVLFRGRPKNRDRLTTKSTDSKSAQNSPQTSISANTYKARRRYLY